MTDIDSTLSSMDMFEAVSAGLDPSETRQELVEILVEQLPGTSVEHRTYFANLAIGSLFARPGSTLTEAVEYARKLLEIDLQDGLPIAVDVDKAILIATYLPIYEKAVEIQADPVGVLRKNFNLDLKAGRALAARLAEIVKDAKGEEVPASAAEGGESADAEDESQVPAAA